MNHSFYKPTLYQVWLHMAEDSVCHSEKKYYFCMRFASFLYQ